MPPCSRWTHSYNHKSRFCPSLPFLTYKATMVGMTNWTHALDNFSLIHYYGWSLYLLLYGCDEKRAYSCWAHASQRSCISCTCHSHTHTHVIGKFVDNDKPQTACTRSYEWSHPISLSKAMPITCLTHQQYAIALVLSLQNNQECLIKEMWRRRMIQHET